MNVAEWLYARALIAPAAPALMTGEAVDADYAAFAARAGSLAAALRGRYGIGAGDRVAIFMRNRSDYLEALFGVLWLGATVVPINAKLAPKEAQFIVADSQARLVLVSDDVGAPLAAAYPSIPMLSADDPAWAGLRAGASMPRPAPREGGDVAWLFYTSGTTGRPKGVMLTHANIVAASLCYTADVDTPGPGDAALYAAPISHGAGLYSFINVRAGARHVVPESGGFDADEILDLARSLRDVTFFAAPTMVRRLVECARRRGEDGDGIRTVIYGGGPMYLADIEEAVRVMGPRFVQIYGQGESPMTITALGRALITDRSHPRWRERLASVGTAQGCVEIRLVGPDDAPVATGEVGEIAVRGPQVMAGYWRNPEASAETLRGGWLHTGDLGRLDADGFLTLTDRSKDVIISGGSNIYPREVEEALLLHGEVREVSVVGMPDPEWGEEVVAFVVPKTGAAIDTAALDRVCLDNIARFKRPKRYVFMGELPKNNYGKVLKTELRKLEL
ncbi:MAG: AMP-binding protein [Aquamicrobium sp.]|uniref:class I adenylate-forming enzyme family protein n=1 Tax=Aquamicrobium sp. TaxID=1872579 RepID=UPI00349EE9EF|nr:AMP-binding protein [Aquamicrobium sp.]